MKSVFRSTVVAIVVHYQTVGHTARAVGQLLRAEACPDLMEHVVVVMNGSTTSEMRELGSLLEQELESTRQPRRDLIWRDMPMMTMGGSVSLICSRENLGYSRGLNLGVAYAAESGRHGEYLLLMNSDVVMLQESVGAMVHCDTVCGGRIGLWGPVVVNPETGRIVQAGLKYHPLTTRRSRLLEGRPLDAARTPLHPDFVSGAIMMIRRGVFTRLGGMPAPYFLYYEEVELADRVREIGLNVGVCAGAFAVHEGGGSTMRETTGRSKTETIVYHANRSAVIYSFRNQSWGTLFAVVVVRSFARVAFPLVSLRLRDAWIGARGILDGLRYVCAHLFTSHDQHRKFV